MHQVFTAYLITIGWALVGSVSMAAGIAIALKLFDLSTPKIDEWQLIKENNIPMGIIFASVILALGYVIGNCVRP